MSGLVRALLTRGMLAGLVAGVAAFAFATVVGEPWVREAIAYEETASAADEHHDVGGTVVSRTVQSTAGLLTGTAVAGVALGGLFALVYAFALGRVGPRQTAGTRADTGRARRSSRSPWCPSSSTRRTRRASAIPRPSAGAPCST